MSTSSRSRPFVFTFFPNDAEVDEHGNTTSSNPRIIPVNSFAPIELENQYFKGCMMLIHETGNEPGQEQDQEVDADGAQLRGVALQLQGKFKEAATADGIVLWAGGELQDTLKLGWFMQSVLKLCGNYAKKKTEGRLYFNIGSKTEVPQMTFPALQVFTVVVTPEGSTPPRLGSKELDEVPWQGPKELSINSKDTYTLKYSTPFVDLCSWELLKVPGVSPMPLENILGDIYSSRVMLYDLKKAGTHACWRKGVLIEWLFCRGQPGEKWHEDDILDGRKDDPEEQIRELSPRNRPPDMPDEASDASDSSQGDDVIDLMDDVDENGVGDDDSDSSQTSEDSLLDEDEEALSRAESTLAWELEGWRRRRVVRTSRADEPGVSVRVPFYIEAIDRRRRWRLRVWYVFCVSTSLVDEYWHAKAFPEIASLCGKRRTLRARMKTFRRGSGRGCLCYGVHTLEHLRHVARQQLHTDSKLKRAVLQATEATRADRNQGTEDSGWPSPLDPSADGTPVQESPQQLRNLGPAELARTFKNRRTKSQVPPLFLIRSGSAACELAFAHAKEGRGSVLRESLVGVVHFEGRLCEELVRLSRNGILRCFTPYDCDKPRLKLSVADIKNVELLDGLFLGRFWQWQVETELRSFVFCSPDQSERDEWIRSIMEFLREVVSPQPGSLGVQNVIAASLMDCTRARRWRPTKRLVLNDRILLDDSVDPPLPQFMETMLDQVISFRTKSAPAPAELKEFMNGTCMLKAVRFEDWPANELLAFWLNVYHCLLLHGMLLLGTPKSRGELSRFYRRVSYLVGLRPVSLKEIEHIILRMPNLDSVTGLRATGQARARQFVGFCGMCRRRAQRADGCNNMKNGRDALTTSCPSSSSSVALKDGGDGDHSPTNRDGKEKRNKHGNKMACMPMLQVHIPQPPWNRPRVYACLFLGQSPEAFVVPKQDLRVVLCLNRGNHSCLPEVPVFRSGRDLDAQLDEVAREFVKEFVRVQEHDSNATRATFPHCCKCLKREMNMDNDGMLSFVWRFLPPDLAKPSRKMQVKFEKYRREPRQLFEHARLHRGYSTSVGSEFDVVAAAAQALAKLAEKGYVSGRKVVRSSSSGNIEVSKSGETSRGSKGSNDKNQKSDTSSNEVKTQDEQTLVLSL